MSDGTPEPAAAPPTIVSAQQFALKCEEVVLLQAQVQRLSNLIDGSAAAEGVQTAGAGQADLQQLQQAQRDLAEAHTLLQQQARRSGALKLLLAEKLLDLQATTQQLQDAQQERALAQQLASDKEDDAQALRTALAAANCHILQLSGAGPGAGAGSLPASRTHSQAGAPPPPPPLQQQQQQLEEQRRRLSSQAAQLDAAQHALAELTKHVAIQHDSCAFAERRAAALEQQLQALTKRCRGCGHAQRHPPPQLGSHPDTASTHAPPAQDAAGAQCSSHGQQQQPCADLQRASSGSIASSIAAAISSATSSLSAAAAAAHSPKGDAGQDQQQPCTQRSLSPLDKGLAAARTFVAQREADAAAARRVNELAAANSRLEAHLHGLQTLVSAKTAQANRLCGEVKQLAKQLRQAEAAAAADLGQVRAQLSHSSERAAQLEAALLAAQLREQHLQAQLLGARSKLAQVLATLVEDAGALQRHQPAQHKHLADDTAAALAEAHALAADATAMAAAAAACAPLSSHSSRRSSMAADCSAGHSGSGTAGAAHVRVFEGASACTVSAEQAPKDSKTDLLRKLLAGGSVLGNSSKGTGSLGVLSAGISAGTDGGSILQQQAQAHGKQNAASRVLDALRLGGRKASRDACDEEGIAAGVVSAVGRQSRARTRTGSEEWGFELLPDR